MKDTTIHGNSVGFCGLLTIVFIALKLMNYIEWSWWLVLSPLWIPPVILIIAFVVLFCIFFLK